MSPSPQLVPLILLGVVIGCIKRGEDGAAIGLCVGVAALLIVQFILDEIDESRERKRREQESQR